MAEFTTPADVRAYLQANGTTGQWSNELIGSNIAAASGNLQRWTGRQFEAQSNTTKVFSTMGRSRVAIPDARVISSVVLNSSILTADQTFYAIPDRLNTGVYVALELPARRGDYRAYSDWFDRNLDSWYWRGRLDEGVPNDLEVTASWGHVPLPAELQHATIVLAGYYTLRSDALLSGAVQRIDQGTIFDLSRLPVEVNQFVDTWRLGDMVAAA